MEERPIHILSHLNDELDLKMRGHRRWSMMKITGDRWFQVEARYGNRWVPEVSSYLLPDIKDAIALTKQLEHCDWIALRLYTRLPLVAPPGFILETVDQVFATQEGRHLFLLASGLLICDPYHDMPSAVMISSAKEIYRRK